jgi:hypothetical protein
VAEEPIAKPVKAGRARTPTIVKILPVVILLLAAGGAAIAWVFWPQPKYPVELQLVRWKPDGAEAVTSDPCVGRTRCVVVYLSPGGPPSKQWVQTTLPQLRQAWQASDKPGLRVIVGNSLPAKMETMAQNVGDPVYLDTTNTFLVGLRAESFPFVMVLDELNKVLKSGESADEWLAKEREGGGAK